MRATKGYVAGVGTTGALMGAIGCAFAVLSTVVAVQGWPLSLTAPSVATLEEQAPSAAEAFPSLLDVFPAAGARRLASAAGSAPHTTAQVLRAGRVRGDGGPLTSTLEPVAGGPQRSAGGSAGRVPSASAAGPAPGPGGSLAPAPAQPGVGSGGSGTSTPPAPSTGSSPSLGGTVTQVTSGAGTVVSQTGQQLSGTVQGATGQLGGVVGQVSPAAGQAVTQTGQVAGGVVSGATGAAGQVVSGAGATVGGLLGGLGGTRTG
ncbi:MAG TPA: hypothetical protein VKB03_11150 [Conexibacter sp.]|nr:hypothetical protein [Conexibacter sp.]